MSRSLRFLSLVALIVLSIGSVARIGAESKIAAESRPRVALVLSGGSALSLAHIGVIRELEAAGIPIDMVMGTSMGSLVGGLYAAGYSPDEMARIVTGLDWSALFMEGGDPPEDRYALEKKNRLPIVLGLDRHGLALKRGLVEGQNILALFTSLVLHELPVRNFDELPVPYRSVAADIATGEKVVFSSGSLAEAMRSSMSIPGIFSPYVVDGRSLVDGGIVDNMPVDLARQMGADIVIAVECRPRLARPEELGSSLAITGQTANLYIESNMRASRAEADLHIRPDLSSFNSASFADAAGLIAAGEKGAKEAEASIRDLASRVAAGRALVAPEGQPNRAAMRDTALLSGLRVMAPSAADQARARREFEPLLGRRLDRAQLGAAIERVYKTGLYSLVKFDLEPEAEGALGIVELVPDAAAEADILAGLRYRGLLSTFPSSEIAFVPALLLSDVTNNDSALYVEGGLGTQTEARIEFFQPFGPFYAKPFLSASSRYMSYPLGDGIYLRSQASSIEGGAWIGAAFGKAADLSLGYSYGTARGSKYGLASSSSTSESDSASSGLVGSALGELKIDSLYGSAFPERGFSLDARARWADPSLGGDTAFLSVDLYSSLAIPLSSRLTLGLAARAATDFSGYASWAQALPESLLFDLRSGEMFYGLEPDPGLETGDHVAGLALEGRYRLGQLSRLFGGDLYALANVSAGAAKLSSDETSGLLPLRWNPSIGLGARIGPNLGLRAMGGLVVDENPIAPLRPAFSLELGSLEGLPQERR